MASSSAVTIRILGDGSSFQKAAKATNGALSGISDHAKKAGTAIRDGLKFAAEGMAAGAAGVVAFAGEAVKAAVEEQAALANLHHSFANAGVPASVIKSNDDWMVSLSNATGVAVDQLAPAQNLLVTSGIKLKDSQRDLAIAMDISTARGIPLEAVTKAMGKAANGSTGGLAKLGLATKDASGKALTLSQILDQANKKMGGATVAATKTAAGQMKLFHNSLHNLTVEVGNSLLPIFTKFVGFLAQVLVPWMQREWPKVKDAIVNAFDAVKPTLDDFASKVKTIIGEVVGWFKEHWPQIKTALMAVGDYIHDHFIPIVVALGVVFLAVTSPVTLIIIAIGVLVAGVIKAYTRFSAFHNMIDAIGRLIRDKIVPFIQTKLVPAFQAIGSFIVTKVVPALLQMWLFFYQKILPIFQTVIQFIVTKLIPTIYKIVLTVGTVVVTVIKWFGGLVTWFKSLPGKIGAVFSGLADILTSPFRTAFNVIKSLWNNTVGKLHFTIPSWVPGIGGKGFDVPNMALGGIVTRPTLAVIGEAGPEAVVPLGSRGFGSGGGGDNVTVHVHGSVVTEKDLMRFIKDSLITLKRKGYALP